MSRGGESREGAGAEGRPVAYCLIPAELGERLHELLRSHFAQEPDVEVVVERRGAERRSGEDRRLAEGEPPAAGERRQVHAPACRRIGERRARVAALEPLPLPRRARRYAERIRFFERVEPAAKDAEDSDTARLVARFQAGDVAAFDTLYLRYFDRVYTYLRIALNQREEAEDAAQEVFVRALEALPRYEQRGKPFQAWLFTIVRNVALTQLRKLGRIELMEPEELERERLRNEREEDAEVPEIIEWITDRDLTIFVERLPLHARQVLVLRYMLDLTSAEAGKVLGRSPDDVRMIQHRALEYLRERLSAVRQPTEAEGGTGRERASARAPIRQSLVLRGRRFSLISWR